MKCYLCSSVDVGAIRSRLRNNVRRRVLRCSACSLVWLEPRNEDLKAYYRAEYRTEFSPSTNRPLLPQEIYDQYIGVAQERVARVAPLLTPGSTVLEIGCATGHFLKAIEPLAGRRIGLEYNVEHSQFIRDTQGIDVYSDPLEETDLPQEMFDVIFMFHIFEHIEDPRKYLSGLRKYLAPGGSIYIEVPNVDDALLSTYGIDEYASFYYKAPHLFYYSPGTLTELAAQAGFEGEIEMVQRYTFVNHMHWITAGFPQGDAMTAMNLPNPITDSGTGIGGGFADEFTEFLKGVDGEYRDLLKRHGLAESIAFRGRPRN